MVFLLYRGASLAREHLLDPFFQLGEGQVAISEQEVFISPFHNTSREAPHPNLGSQAEFVLCCFPVLQLVHGFEEIFPIEPGLYRVRYIICADCRAYAIRIDGSLEQCCEWYLLLRRFVLEHSHGYGWRNGGEDRLAFLQNALQESSAKLGSSTFFYGAVSLFDVRCYFPHRAYPFVGDHAARYHFELDLLLVFFIKGQYNRAEPIAPAAEGIEKIKEGWFL